MPRKRAVKPQPTEAALQADATAAHEAQLAENPVAHPLTAAATPDAQDEGVPLYPSTPPELLAGPAADPFDAAIAARAEGQFEVPPAETPATHPERPAHHAEPASHHGHHEEGPHAHEHHRQAPTHHGASHAHREQSRRADPFPFHAVHFPDGFSIRVQESDSRKTVEIQFGDGSRAAQPKNFGPIKDALRSAGLHWNGECAWVIDLLPERGSFHQREDAKAKNKAIRTKIEEQVLPQVIGLEEAARGPVELTDGFRERIGKASTAR